MAVSASGDAVEALGGLGEFPPVHASGMSSGCSARSANGRCGRDGAAGRCASSRRGDRRCSAGDARGAVRVRCRGSPVGEEREGFDRTEVCDHLSELWARGRGDDGDGCVPILHDCPNCAGVLKPKAGDCCVFCSYGTVPCPPVQAAGTKAVMSLMQRDHERAVTGRLSMVDVGDPPRDFGIA